MDFNKFKRNTEFLITVLMFIAIEIKIVYVTCDYYYNNYYYLKHF